MGDRFPVLSRFTGRLVRGAGTALLLVALAPRSSAGDPFLDAVVSFHPGANAGFGADDLPGIVLGPPRGLGPLQGSTDVVSLGDGGSITVAFRDNAACDGPGPDLLVFENAFHAGDAAGPLFIEVGVVAVSPDGEHFFEFPYDPHSFAGLAGTHTVLSNPENGIDPTDPEAAGGDPFDLAALGLRRIAYVRITDPGAAIPDPGNRLPPGNSGGFDLDAIAAIHSCDPADESTATPDATPSPTPTRVPAAGDVDGNGLFDDTDRLLILSELFDGDGDALADAVSGGSVRGLPGIDANGDARVTAADLVVGTRFE